MSAKNPLTIEVTRGSMVESRHSGAAVVMDAGGRRVHAWGDGARIVYPRSSIKPLQALVLVETGAADAYALGDEELALASASHSGFPEHTEAVARWLERAGLSPGDLECGAHEPMDADAARALAAAGGAPGPLHNNCSGKHTGFLTTARHLGEATAGYSGLGHPVQQRMAALLAAMGDCDLSEAPTGTDGCGIPVMGMPLASMALALARMADPQGLPPERAAAAKRVFAAMTAKPRLVAGPGRFDTVAMEAGADTFAVKGGAEGMHGAILPGLGLGVALKIDDGAKRASEVAMAAILEFLGVLAPMETGAAATAMAAFLEAPVTNARGETVGTIRMAEGWEPSTALKSEAGDR